MPQSLAPASPPPTPTASTSPFRQQGPTAKDRTLHTLAVAVQDGESRALAILLAKLRADLPKMVQGAVVRRGFRVCSDDIDEVVQQILIGVWTTDLARFDRRRGSFGAFLSRRIRWALLDHVRGLARRKTDVLLENVLQSTLVAADRDDPHALLEAATRERLLLALPALVETALNDERAENPVGVSAIVQKDVEGRPLRPLASAMGCHPATLTRARQRGLARIRERIGPALSRTGFVSEG